MSKESAPRKPLRVRFGYDSPLDKLMLETASRMRGPILRSMAESYLDWSSAGGIPPAEMEATPRGNSHSLIGKPFFVILHLGETGQLNTFLRDLLNKGVTDIEKRVRQLAARYLVLQTNQFVLPGGINASRSNSQIKSVSVSASSLLPAAAPTSDVAQNLQGESSEMIGLDFDPSFLEGMMTQT